MAGVTKKLKLRNKYMQFKGVLGRRFSENFLKKYGQLKLLRGSFVLNLSAKSAPAGQIVLLCAVRTAKSRLFIIRQASVKVRFFEVYLYAPRLVLAFSPAFLAGGAIGRWGGGAVGR